MPPSSRRDPWAWASVLAVLPLLLGSLGAPLGEPVAEDFDFLHRALLEPTRTLLDGGGSTAFWRPVSHQLYYDLLGRLILAHPRVVAGLHVVLMGLAGLLVYRWLRRSWSGPVAFAATSFPLLAQSSRTLITWPSQFVDLGAFLFSALALHEAAARRSWSALTALALALLCKEVAWVTALLLPFMPGLPIRGRGERARWIIASGAVLVTWAAVYAAIRRHAGLELPHALERDPGLLRTPVPVRIAWAGWNSVRAIFGMPLARPSWEGPAGAVVGLLVLAAGVGLALDPRARERLRGSRDWLAWGGLWFALASATLGSMYPMWSPNRSQFASLGLGILLVVATAAVRPALTALLVVTRLGLMTLAPSIGPGITPEPARLGAFVDFPRIGRLQRLMRQTRARLLDRFPSVPHEAVIGFRNLPLSSEYAFGGPRAVQAWYRDSTLRWISYAEFRARPDRPVLTFVEYQTAPWRQVVLLDPAALRAQLAALERLQQGRFEEALAAFERSDAAQTDRDAVLFLGDLAGRRALCCAELRRFGEAESLARHALEVSARDVGARYVLAVCDAVAHRDDAALAQLDTLLVLDPHDAESAKLRDLLRARRSTGRPR